MGKIKDGIVDLVALDRELADFSGTKGLLKKNSVRADLLQVFQNLLQSGREHLLHHHLAGASGGRIVRGHAFLMDVLLQRLYALLRRCETACTLIAVGGYGRKEMAPYSDTDLLFLIPEGSEGDKVGVQVERMLYFLWDLGLDVGYAVRTIPECAVEARKEIEIRTSLLESRFVVGDRALFKRYRDVLFDEILTEDGECFFRAKLQEQRKRHERFGDSLFYLEPNIKENPGGLRDIHTFFWISKYRYRVGKVRALVDRGVITEEENRTFTRCRAFLWRVRNALHYRTNRREDRLTFEYQRAIAEEFGFRDRVGMRGVEQFMRRYYQVARQVGNLSQIFLMKYQESHSASARISPRHLEDVFEQIGDKVTVTREEVFREKPSRLMQIFEVAQRHGKGIHPEVFRLISRDLDLINRDFRRDPEVNRLFLEILNGQTAVAWVLRKMNMCGFLGRFVPEFGRIVAQTQHDLFHVYTVDEHSILAVEALRHIRSGHLSDVLPLSTQLMGELRRPVVLYLAVLFHDIAKGREGKHQEKGAPIAQHICRRLGLQTCEADLVAWLVRHHLILSRTAFRHDISDPQTVLNLANIIGEKERLDLLLLLTVADVRAVGPGVWTQWKATLLRKLYSTTLEILEKGLFHPEEMLTLADAKKESLRKLFTESYGSERVERHLSRFYASYFFSLDMETLADHFLMLALKTVVQDPMVIRFAYKPASETTEVLIYTYDHPGLMTKISGALASERVNILNASISVTTDGMALDVYVIQELGGRAITSPDRTDRIEKKIRDVVSGRQDPGKLLARPFSENRQRKLFLVPTHIEINNQFSDTHTLLEVTASDRLGLLFTITKALMAQSLRIRTAKIATYGERVVDVFYVRDLFGLKIWNKARLSKITKAVTEAIQKLDQQALKK